MSWFFHGCHGQRHHLWVHMHNGSNGHTPKNRLTEKCSLSLLYTSLILDIHVMINWHLSKQGRYPLTSITWPYCGLNFTAYRGHMFFWSWLLTKCWFSIGSRAYVRLTCWKQGTIVWKTVHPGPGFKFKRIITFPSTQMFFCCFVLCTYTCKCMVIVKLKTEGQTINRKPHCKVTKLKSKFYLFLG